eukprot:PhF_6_TR17635/c0_g1_i1/m.26776
MINYVTTSFETLQTRLSNNIEEYNNEFGNINYVEAQDNQYSVVSETACERLVHERRELLRNYRLNDTSCITTITLQDYKQHLRNALVNIQQRLKQQPSSMAPVVELAPPPRSRDPVVPLFHSPDTIYPLVSIVDWLWCLPDLCAKNLPPASQLNYTRTMIETQSAPHCCAVLEALIHELDGIHITHFTDHTRQHMNEAWRSLFESQVDVDTVAEEFVAIALYTHELKINHNLVITNPDVHGLNSSLYGVMNWACRAYRDEEAAKIQTEENTIALQKTLQIFMPLIAHVDTSLSRLPIQRCSLYRGVRSKLSLQRYTVGNLVPWTSLSSTSHDFHTAHTFGDTLFIVHVHNAVNVDFLAVYQESECLLPTYTWMKSRGVMSPTLLRMLGSACSYVQVQSIGDKPTIDERIASLLQTKEYMKNLYSDFCQKYVEARLHSSPPPIPHGIETTPLFQYVIDEFGAGTAQHLLLLGSGGTGKTTTALALHCYLTNKKLFDAQGRPVVSVF